MKRKNLIFITCLLLFLIGCKGRGSKDSSIAGGDLQLLENDDLTEGISNSEINVDNKMFPSTEEKTIESSLKRKWIYPLDWYVGKWICINAIDPSFNESDYLVIEKEEDKYKIFQSEKGKIFEGELVLEKYYQKYFVPAGLTEAEKIQMLDSSDYITARLDGRGAYTVSIYYSGEFEKDNMSIMLQHYDIEVVQYQREEFLSNAVINDNAVRLREFPSLDSEIITNLEKGIVVKLGRKSEIPFTINGETFYWFYVENDEKQTGWLYGKYLDIKK